MCRERRILAEGETLSQHAVISAQRALEMAGVDATSLDLILLATSSPDDLFGSACEVRPQRRVITQPLGRSARELHRCTDRLGCAEDPHLRQLGAEAVLALSRCLGLQVQKILGAKQAMAFDITAACSGFVVALVTAAQFIRTGLYRNVLVIGGDALSRFVDWRDRCAPAARTLGLRCAATEPGRPAVCLPRCCPAHFPAAAQC